MVPAHVERIRARKDMFSPLLSWKEDQGDLVTAQRFGQPRFPFSSISQAAWEMHTICWQPQTSGSQPAQKRSPWQDLLGHSWSPELGGGLGWASFIGIRQRTLCKTVSGLNAPKNSGSGAAKL